MRMFKSKSLKVQDYPDPPYIITIYGKSEKSRFKLGDKVVVINNPRVGFKQDIIIGFDDDGDSMLENCSWSNTRGGYSDENIKLYSEFLSIKNNLPEFFKEKISKKIEDYKNNVSNILDEKKVERITNSFLAENWYKLETIEQKLERLGLKMPNGWFLLPLNNTIKHDDMIIMCSFSTSGKETKWKKVFRDWSGHSHSDEDHVIIRKKPIVGDYKFDDLVNKYTQEDLDNFNKIFL